MQTISPLFGLPIGAPLPAAPSIPEAQASGLSFGSILQSARQEAPSFEEQWKAAFMTWRPGSAGQSFYHVMETPKITDGIWQNNDFPYDKFFQAEVDPSVFTWQPTRGNPSQLDAKVQAKIGSTLGKNAIVVPPELDEKMKNDPALAKKVAGNIERLYAFHSQGPSPYMTMPGTKFYGTRTYSSVIVLDKDGEVAHACCSSGGGFIGPDEHTLRQIEREKAKKRARREASKQIAAETAAKHADAHRASLREAQSEAVSLSRAARSPFPMDALHFLQANQESPA